MFDVKDNIFHGFASVCITYILIHRDISIISIKNLSFLLGL